MMNRHLFGLIAFCVVVFFVSFYVAFTKDSAASYSLSVVSFVCVVALYAAGVLGYKVGGSHLSLEAKVQALETKNTALQKLATALLKVMYVLSHPDTPMAVSSAEQHNLIDDYLKDIQDLVDDDVRAKVNEAVLRAHENGRHC